jgi:hypothetical protein
MRRRRFNGRAIAVLAAYLVALQAVLLPLSMPAAAAFGGSLCLTERTDGPSRHPVRHDQGCPCCAGCGLRCHQPGLAGGPAVVVRAPPSQVVATVGPARLEERALPVRRPAQMPRAPPAG